ncbi:hypothetical protein [Hyalangium rubrum]|uniref:Immediate early protein ICP0 n=1 Tax=Hyalangium rubrum TaxID=3103134 RepID=A0ABU5H3S9_9BACT|nr:hypothetical protein [Hyalangium sp. s54d21]MDY7227782.1 hypothetical protein [Hyalangium sp. s54d21]
MGPAPTGEHPRVGRAPREGGDSEPVDWGSSPETSEPGEELPSRGRTGERPALGGRTRTGTRPALSDERPSTPTPSTGSRPGLPAEPERPSRTTGSRPSLPAEPPRKPATFADALTQERGTRASTATATLVMPRVEVPEPPKMTRGGRATREVPTPPTSIEPGEGRTVTPMDTPIGRGGGTRLTRMPEGPGGKGPADEAGETLPGREVGGGKGGKELRPGRPGEPRGPAKPPEKDGFGQQPPTTGTRPALGQGPVKGPVIPVKELVPRGLEKLPDQEGVAQRFASDAALLHQQVRPSDLPSTERAMRLWTFFAAYAEAAAAHPPTSEAQEAFDRALKEQGFAELRDAHTGSDGLKAARWVLESAHPEEAQQRAEQVELEPPPEVLLSESAQPQEAPTRKPEEQKPRPQGQEAKESAFAQAAERAPLERVEGHSEFLRVSPQTADSPRPVMVPLNGEQRRAEEDPTPQRLSGDAKRLGGNMIWNVLHRFRGESPEDSAIEKEKWNQIAFAAMLAFVGLMLVGIMLVAL